MRLSQLGFVAFLAALLFLMPVCGGGGGGSAPVPGQPQLQPLPIRWVDANVNNLYDGGDHLIFSFDRTVDPGINGPDLDVAITGPGVIGATATWLDTPDNNLTLVTDGATALWPGIVGAPSLLDVVPGNTLLNPVDGSTPAIPSGVPQSIMANFSNSGLSFGTVHTTDAYFEDFDAIVSFDIGFARHGPNRIFYNPAGTGSFIEGGNWTGDTGASTYGLAFVRVAGRVRYIIAANGVSGDMQNYVYRIEPGGPDYTPVHDVATNPPYGWIPAALLTYARLGNNDTRGIASADFDSDAVIDVVCVNRQAQNGIYFGGSVLEEGLFDDGDGAGLLTARGPEIFGPLGGDTVAVDVGDLDGLGSPDIATVEGDALIYYFVDAAGNAGGANIRGGLGNVQEVLLEDLDGDGDLDALVGLGSNGGIRIFRNNGAGNLQPVGGALGASSVYGLACLDVNADGALDIISANSNNQNNEMWLCTSTGALTYVNSGYQFGGQNTWGVAVTRDGAGVNGIGTNDIVTAETGNGGILYLGGL